MLTVQAQDVYTIVANVLSLSTSDSVRLLSYINRACQRLLEEGKWKGTLHRMRICAVRGTCITWPRELETIETAALCSRPITVRNGWFEFLPNGPGIRNGCSGRNLIDEGEFPAFDDVQGTGKLLAVYTDAQEVAGASIKLQFTDGNGLWKEETINLPPKGTYAYTANTCAQNGLAHVIKDETIGTVRLYEYNPTTGALRPLGYYQPDETVPVYRRSRLPGANPVADTTTSTTCSSLSVDVIGTIRFIPATLGTDWLPISHPEAIRLGCQAILKEENNKLSDAAPYWQMAFRCLDKQLSKYNGDGAEVPIQMRQHQMPAVRNLV